MDGVDPTTSGTSTASAAIERRMGETEFVMLMALISAMAALAIDILLPAFGAMRSAFGLAPDATNLSLTITLFFVGSGIGNLIYGPLADAWGRKPVLLASLALYAGAALAAALATNLTWLLVARFFWGFGAGGPRVLTQAIVRDRFSGDAMARVMSTVQAVFFLGPIFAPLVGAGLLAVGSWRWVMAFGVFSAIAAGLWSLRLKETLVAHDRRPLSAPTIGKGVAVVVGHRRTFFLALSVTFISGAFYSFLGSTELVFAELFDRGDWFVPYFSAMAAFLGICSLSISRVLRRVSASSVTTAAGAAMIVFSAAQLALALIAGGEPPFLFWLVLFSLANLGAVATMPGINSLALEPMGALAGTAASVIGFITAVGGAGLAAITDRSLDNSVVPLGVAYLVYSTIAYLFQLAALRHTPTAAV